MYNFCVFGFFFFFFPGFIHILISSIVRTPSSIFNWSVHREHMCGLWMCVSATVAAAATTAAIAFVSKNSENVHNPAIAWMNERTNEWCKKTTSNSSNYSKLKRNRCAWHSMTAFQFESSAHRMCVSVCIKKYIIWNHSLHSTTYNVFGFNMHVPILSEHQFNRSRMP